MDVEYVWRCSYCGREIRVQYPLKDVLVYIARLHMLRHGVDYSDMDIEKEIVLED